MRVESITLAADGRSDRCLIPAIRWTVSQALRARHPESLVRFDFADVRATPLDARIAEALAKYPCDVLVVHRDAEREDPSCRFDEISEARSTTNCTPTVGVVPVRMSEAWLLVSERAIRRAAGNPQGRGELGLPKVRDLERTSDPKHVLREAILAASEARGRRRDRLRRDLPQRIQRVANLIEDYSPLRQLSAFQRFERDLEATLHPPAT
ncbi:MAG: hypothetical protein MJD61_10095 [Proteobacteria bacterium]|nr:hypothetical protein [Pseudomonadota bacterium]